MRETMMTGTMKMTMLIMVLMLQEVVEGSRILFIAANAAKTHEAYFKAVAVTLANHGHQITFVTPFQQPATHKNIREVKIQNLTVASHLDHEAANGVIYYDPRFVLGSPGVELCSDALGQENVQDLLLEEFDLGMFNVFLCDCFLSMFYQLKIPYVGVSPSEASGFTSTMIGNPDFMSFVRFPSVFFNYPFTLHERVHNALVTLFYEATFRRLHIPKTEAECRGRGLCPATMPNLHVMRENSSLLLVNSVRTLDNPARAVVPSIVHCGGIHIKKPNALPQRIENWIAEAGESGFIYFNLGSYILVGTMPERLVGVLKNVFGSLKQKVLMEWDSPLTENLSENIIADIFLPHYDIISHPRLRLFVTAGEPLTVMDAMYYGVPILGGPMTETQDHVVREVVLQGWGRRFQWPGLTESDFKIAVLSTITDDKIVSEAKRRSTLMKDRPLSPGRMIKYWVDYVIRHKGAPHLRSPLTYMPWYEVYNIDLWTSMLVGTIGMLYTLRKLFALLGRCCSKLKEKLKRD